MTGECMAAVPLGRLVTLAVREVPAGTIDLRARVQWAADFVPAGLGPGRRFFHVRHDDDSPPAISELIDAAALHAISAMEQKMSSYAYFDAPTTVALEVWSDRDTDVADFSLEAHLRLIA